MGIGLMGREGSQASRASDFALSRFRYPLFLFDTFWNFSYFVNETIANFSSLLNKNQIFEETVVSSWTIQLYSNNKAHSILFLQKCMCFWRKSLVQNPFVMEIGLCDCTLTRLSLISIQIAFTLPQFYFLFFNGFSGEVCALSPHFHIIFMNLFNFDRFPSSHGLQL